MTFNPKSFHASGRVSLAITLALSGVQLLLPTGSQATDWPEWGGRPMRNMYSAEKNLPSAFGKIDYKQGTEEIDPKGAQNMRWAVLIGSLSYGNVTVAQG